jgi:hypothetical protein
MDKKHPTFVYCSSCSKELEQVLQCSLCKNATYCSKECQKAHWKDHKPRCQLLRRSKEVVPKREFRLLQQWRDLVRNKILPLCVAQAAKSKQEFCKQPTDFVVNLQVQFDYNFKTFLPTERPTTSARQSEHEVVFSTFASNPKPPPGSYDHVILLQCEGQLIGVPMRSIVEVYERNYSWDDIMSLLKADFRLSSSVFDTWNPLLQANLKTQINAVRASQAFSPFLVAALHMDTNKPVHTKKIIIVYLELGYGLGEIKKLESFETTEVNAFLSSLAQSEHVSRAQLELYRTDSLNLKNSPSLGRAEPGSVLLPVVFIHKRAGLVFVLPNGLVHVQTPCGKGKADRSAQQYFRTLQTIQLPKVTSPALE